MESSKSWHSNQNWKKHTISLANFCMKLPFYQQVLPYNYFSMHMKAFPWFDPEPRTL